MARRANDPQPRRGVYMISVAAELAGMHPQTLRIYESRGLIEPERTSGGTRRYSADDVERLRRIQELTSELGMNLAGVEKVFELEQELERMRDRMRRMERQAERIQQEMAEEIERVRKSFRAELVPYQPPGSALIPARDARAPGVRIPIQRQGR
jgi:MerR family transcriptional regulator, heat shock protein HspR